VPSGKSKRKRADNDSVAYGDAAAQSDSIKQRAAEDDEYSAPPPQKLSMHVFLLFSPELFSIMSKKNGFREELEGRWRSRQLAGSTHVTFR
jgi:hypothetical protein